MASIVVKSRKTSKTYYISYRITDSSGKKIQRWVRCNDKTDARLLLDEVEAAERQNREFKRYESFGKYAYISSGDLTLEELVYRYAEHRSKTKWEAKSRQNAMSIIKNYIVPYIGGTPVSKVTTCFLQAYYDDLPNHKAVKGNHKSEPPNISPRTVREVHKVLRPAFSMAKKWGLVEMNPTYDLELPKIEKYVREQWSGDELKEALSICESEELELAQAVMFACTLRPGELYALTWPCVHISEQDVTSSRCCIDVKQELARLTREDIAKTRTTVYLEFPSFRARTKTVVVLKKPKTASSVRRVYLPTTLARRLSEHREKQQAQKAELGESYYDYDLVFPQANGLPHANGTLLREFKRFVLQSELKNVDLYALRHSGATEKLRSTKNIKSVQGDMGHSSSQMLLNTYAAIIDEDRKSNAEMIEKAYFSGEEKGV